MSDELKPCPWCGGKEISLIDEHGTYRWCHCNKCQSESESDLGVSGAWEKWNTRPLEDALRAELEKARDEYAEGSNIHYQAIKIVADERDALRAKLEIAVAIISKWANYGYPEFTEALRQIEGSEK